MKAVANHLWGTTELEGRHIVVLGTGKVGYALARHLVEERARVSVADVSVAAVERAVHDFGAEVVPPEKAHAVDCDIYSPCALGGGLNATTIPELRCAAVVGSANNQLGTLADADLLAGAGVLYAPDYVVNAGGVINIAEELVGYHRERAYANVRRIYDTTLAVIHAAERDGVTTAVAADRLAEERMQAMSRVQQIRAYPGRGRWPER